MDFNHYYQLLLLLVLVIICIPIIIFSFFLKRNRTTVIESFVIDTYTKKNGKKWYVQSPESIDLLEEMIRRINLLIDEIKKHPLKTYTINRLRYWDSSFVSENKINLWQYHAISYSINKGDELIFCLRDKETNSLHDVNTMMFVAIHELSHIVTSENNHTELFWSNMRSLLKTAEEIGIYTPVDYDRNPVEYCGVMIDKSM